MAKKKTTSPVMDKPNFGLTLRAARLRFYYTKKLNCFMRVTDSGDNFLIELRPNAVDSMASDRGREHRVLEDPDLVVSLSPVLSNMGSVTKSIDLLLDVDGNQVGSS